MGLSPRQKAILEFIRKFQEENGYPPTIRDIGAGVGISSTSVVNYNLKILEREGKIERDPTVSRGIKLVESRDSRTVRVPVLGTIAAGDPIPVLSDGVPETADDYLELTRDIIKDEKGIYALHVKGTSMIDALVDDGDVVILRQQDTANDGDMVAVWLADREETTLKRLYREGQMVRLQPANPTMEPIWVDAQNVRIQGRVIAVIRQLA